MLKTFSLWKHTDQLTTTFLDQTIWKLITSSIVEVLGIAFPWLNNLRLLILLALLFPLTTVEDGVCLGLDRRYVSAFLAVCRVVVIAGVEGLTRKLAATLQSLPGHSRFFLFLHCVTHPKNLPFLTYGQPHWMTLFFLADEFHQSSEV